MHQPSRSPVERDLRIDFFRGLALYVILIDHIALNPLARFTYHRFGFSDGAEAFVFLSGISCGLAYMALLSRKGWTNLFSALTRRIALLYLFYLASSMATIALIWVLREPLKTTGMLEQQWMSFMDHPLQALLSAGLLIGQPQFPGILILYMTLTVVIPIFLATARRSLILALIISGAVWLLPQMKILGLDQATRLHPYFNPLAWQFLFCIGMYIGIAQRTGQTVLTTLWANRILQLAWLIVLLSLAWRVYPTIASRLGMALDWHRSIAIFDGDQKLNLAAIRLIHFLSVVILVNHYVGPRSQFMQWGRGLMVSAGRWSLEVFSIGAVLSVAGTIILLLHEQTVFEIIALNAALILISALFVVALSVWPRKVGRTAH